MLVSIDPGLNHCGVAYWECSPFLQDKRLTPVYKGEIGYSLSRACLVRSSKEYAKQERILRWEHMATQVWLDFHAFAKRQPGAEDDLLIEVPQVYRHSKGDPNDLIDLAGVVGTIIGRYRESATWGPNPKDWKGQIPKEVTEARVNAELHETEQARIERPPASLLHNVYDAIHLGLVYLQKHKLR